MIIPDFQPPDTLAAWEKRHIDPLLDKFSHIGVVDRDVWVPDTFYHLPEEDPSSEIITVQVEPSSSVYKTWETLTYWAKLKKRARGCAVIYRSSFLKRLGGWPLVTTPDTYLLNQATVVQYATIVAIHYQSFNPRHSIRGQIRDGKSRAELNYPIWKTILHSIFRIRPFVLLGYLKEKLE